MIYTNEQEYENARAAKARAAVNDYINSGAALRNDALRGFDGGENMKAMIAGPRKYSRDWVHELLSHHSPDAGQLDRIAGVRAATETFMNALIQFCPQGEDRDYALSISRSSMMYANASICMEKSGL